MAAIGAGIGPVVGTKPVLKVDNLLLQGSNAFIKHTLGVWASWGEVMYGADWIRELFAWVQIVFCMRLVHVI